MCGIVGYVGQQDALEVVLDGLRRLEYRGYDSAGVAILSEDGELAVRKRSGKLANLDKVLAVDPLAGTLGIGHTRWATHGPPTDRNAHPQVDCSGRVAVVHNGTIENFEVLAAGLEARGHRRESDTDTEVVAHLLEEKLSRPECAGDLAAAVRSVCRDLEGSFVLVVAHADEPELVVGARRNLPLVAGVGDGESFLGSDVTAFIAHTREALVIDQDQVVELRRGGITVTDLAGAPVVPLAMHVDWDTAAAEKGGYEFFMLKEIDEQPEAVRQTLGGRLGTDGLLQLDEIALSDDDLRGIEQVVIIGCGSSYHSGMIGKYAIERWCRLPVQVELASEFRYRDPVIGRNTLVIAVSQSGETADTLEAVRHARSQRAWVLAVSNLHQGGDDPDHGDVPRRALPRAGPRDAGPRRGPLPPAGPREHPGPAHRAAHPLRGRTGRRPRDRRRDAGAVPGPARRLPDCPGGRAQAQGAGLRLRRGLLRR